MSVVCEADALMADAGGSFGRVDLLGRLEFIKEQGWMGQGLLGFLGDFGGFGLFLMGLVSWKGWLLVGSTEWTLFVIQWILEVRFYGIVVEKLWKASVGFGVFQNRGYWDLLSRSWWYIMAFQSKSHEHKVIHNHCICSRRLDLVSFSLPKSFNI